MKIVKFLLLVTALFFSAAALAQTQKIFLVEIVFAGGQAKIGQVSNGQGYASEPEKEPEMGPYKYWLEIISSSGKTLELRKFSLDNRVSPRPPYPGEAEEPAGDSQIGEFSKIISLPYYPDVKLLNLYDANRNLLDQKDVSFLIPGCGDGKCGEKENYLTCASDCTAGGRDGWCNKGLNSTDPDCPKTENIVSTPDPRLRSYLWFATVSLIIILASIGLIIYIVRKKNIENQ